MTSSRTTICVARHGAREDYALKANGINWQLTADRPWDPPLADGGVQQGMALGFALQRHCACLNLPPVTKVVSSPFLRCIQTSAGAAMSLGVPDLCIDPAIGEGMLEEFYRSWGVPGADSTWGGPSHYPMGSDVLLDALHPSVHLPAGELLMTPASASRALASTPDVSSIGIDASHMPVGPLAQYRWGDFETEEQLSKRMHAALETLAARHPGQTLLTCRQD